MNPAFIGSTPLAVSSCTALNKSALVNNSVSFHTARRYQSSTKSTTLRASLPQPNPSQPSQPCTETEDHDSTTPNLFSEQSVGMMLLTIGFLFADPSVADAAAFFPPAVKEGFKTLPASLLHPAVMWGVTGTSLYTLWLGYQSSMIRKKDTDADKRKELIKAKVTDRHFQVSSSLFAVVSLTTFLGMANTFNRAGKLFPGPHLYVGLGVIALLSVMASFVPYMQKGKDWARNSHFAAGLIVTGFFAWQAQSGLVIVGKLTKWW